jgi:hypothetical protein
MPTNISAECRRLLETVRQRCPGLLPREPVKAGTVVDAVPLKRPEASALFPAAAVTAAGLDNTTAGRPATVLWREGNRELLVFPQKVTAKFGEGVIVIAIPVSCDQTGPATVHVTFVVGDSKRPAGLICATEGRPRGPETIVDAWGDNLIAFAWHVLLEVAANVAGEAGRDVDGSRLVPIALAASANGLSIVPMARHTFDRARA